MDQTADETEIIAQIAKIDLNRGLSFEEKRELLLSLVSKIVIENNGKISVFLKSGLSWPI